MNDQSRDAAAFELERVRAIVRAFYRDFAADLPQGSHASGSYTSVKTDRFAQKTFEIPGGTYRVAGMDWLLTFRSQRFVGAELARPPGYGGPRVIAVPSESDRRELEPPGGLDGKQA